MALLVNTRAGRGRAGQLAALVERRLREHGCAVRRYVDGDVGGHPHGDVARYPHRAPAGDRADRAGHGIGIGDVGADVLAVVGGDGTVHWALPTVAGTGTALGLIPAGSGNDLAAALGIPADPLAAADLIATGAARRLDLGRTGDRWWATVLCAGFDSAVAARARRIRWPAGPRRYDVALLAELARLRPYPFTLTLAGRPEPVEATLVAVGNTPLYGGGLRICPGAVADDGLLDVTVVGPVSRRELLRVASRLRTGAHLDHPAVSQHRVRGLELAAAGLTAYADGEPVGPLPLTETCHPGAVQVITPPRAP